MKRWEVRLQGVRTGLVVSTARFWSKKAAQRHATVIEARLDEMLERTDVSSGCVQVWVVDRWHAV